MAQNVDPIFTKQSRARLRTARPYHAAAVIREDPTLTTISSNGRSASIIRKI